jgi:uncharacterized protein with PIN domain
MGDKLETCPTCQGPLIEIDRYRERLVGCIECNRWRWPGSESVSMALPDEEIEALRAMVRPT